MKSKRLRKLNEKLLCNSPLLPESFLSGRRMAKLLVTFLFGVSIHIELPCDSQRQDRGVKISVSFDLTSLC